MERFYTLQGEGAHSGTPAYFIRLGGCDVGCPWCDVKESWPLNAHPALPVTELVADVLATPTQLVVMTGGEPALHDTTALVDALHKGAASVHRRLAVHVETSGAYPLRGAYDWVTLSPKKMKPALPAVFARADELKVVVYHRSDIQWAMEQAQQVGPACQLFLQPEYSRMQKATQWILAHIAANPRWRLSLQTHKWIGVA